MPAPNNGICPHCKGRLYWLEEKNGAEYYKCAKCNYVIKK